ncbi:MAG: hypothetical protein Ta2F_08470 [Termitinemataceae bacterium]|nr:MAG: hypothetical protein Ta2F_08470 [Termitinemataceae bacterium]
MTAFKLNYARIKIHAAERRGIFVLPENCTAGLIPSVSPQSGGVLNPSARIIFLFLLCAITVNAKADSLRVLIKDSLSVSTTNTEGVKVQLSNNDSALISLLGDTRFIRGIELELTAPQIWLPNQGALAIGIYNELEPQIPTMHSEIRCKRLRFDPIPNKIQTVYQIPLKKNHGLRSTPYVTVLQDIVPPQAFPLLFRIAPIVKEINGDIENIRFVLNVKPIFSDEGIVRIKLLYPDGKQFGPVAVLIDDNIVSTPLGETFLNEGEHYITILSTDYRSENRRFIVESGKILDLSISLHDLTPVMFFEAPTRALIFIDGNLVHNVTAPINVYPGLHEIKIQVSDYAIVRTINVQKGKTYRVAFTVDLDVLEE